MNNGYASVRPGEDDSHEDHVDDHLEQRVDDPPEVAEERVRALLLEVGADQVPDEPAARPGLADPLGDQPDGPRPRRAVVGGGVDVMRAPSVNTRRSIDASRMRLAAPGSPWMAVRGVDARSVRDADDSLRGP